MTKKLLLYITCGVLCLSFIVIAQNKPGITVTEQTDRDRFRLHIRHLVETAQYDSAISYCSYLRKHDSLSYDDMEKALATIAWTKGDKPKAYQYVINGADYLLRTNSVQPFPGMLYDYDYAYVLATDTFLEKIIITKVSEYYSGMQHFPQATAALKFVMLHYRLKKLHQYQTFLEKHSTDAASSQKIRTQFADQEEELTEDYMNEIARNGKLLTWKEAGQGFESQFDFLEERNDATLHLQMKPFFEKAFRNGDISSYLYVDQLVWLAALEEKDDQKLEQLHDSLCVVYKCLQVRRAYPAKNGDSVVIHNANRFGKPQ